MEDAWVDIDGTLTPGPEARLSVFDRGFLFGDSVYEVLRTVHGRPLFWADHLERLVASAGYLGLEVGEDIGQHLAARVAATAGRVASAEKYLRLIVTRGRGDLSLSGPHGPPTHIVIARPLTLLPEVIYREGCALVTFPMPRADLLGLDPRAKTGDRRLGVLAEGTARSAGAHEALRVSPDGRVLEGATSSFFLVRGGALHTPPLGAGILAGITRRKVLALAAAAGHPAQEVEVPLVALDDAEEAFITSTVRGVVPVCRIDARRYGPPGPVTRRILDAYRSAMDEDVPRTGP